MARIFDVKTFAVHDGDGIRTTVFFKGCPLKCRWCHNPEGLAFSSQLSFIKEKCTLCGVCAEACAQSVHRIANGQHVSDKEKCSACGKCEHACPNHALKLYGERTTVAHLLPILLEDRDYYESSGGGVTLSGGECLMQADFCVELLKALKQEGIHTAIDTCGCVPKAALVQVMPYTDVFLYDIKAIDEDVHIKCTGQSNKKILENLAYLNACGCTVEIRIPYVPDYNADQIDKIAAFLSELKCITKVRVLPYHPYAGSKYAALGMENTLPKNIPSETELRQAKAILKAYELPIAE